MTVKLYGVGYIRISDNKQADNHSEEIQKKMILAKAEREGIEIIRWRYDKAESAFRKSASKRGKMKELLNDAKAVDAIIFYDESRLSRKIYDFYEEIYCPIKERFPHVKFYSSQSIGEWNPNDPMVQALFVFAAEESVIKSKRAKDAQYSLLTNNERPGARAPVGYDLIDGMLEPNIEAPIVSLIFDCASWGHSNAVIAGFLNENKVRTKYISQWYSSTIDYILNNFAYAGHLRWDVEQTNMPDKANDGKGFKLFQDLHTPIVSPVMFEIVNQVKQYKNKYGKLDTSFLLRNLLYCGPCNPMLRAKDNSPKSKSKQYLVYRCLACKSNIRANDVHAEVIADLQNKLTSNLFQMIKESKATLSEWVHTLQALTKSVKQTEEHILLNERFLDQQDHSESMAEIIKHCSRYIPMLKMRTCPHCSIPNYEHCALHSLIEST